MHTETTATTLEACIAFLRRDEIKNISTIYFMEDNPVSGIDRVGDSVMVRGVSDHSWVYISSPDEEALKGVAGRLTKDDRFFAVVEDWMLPVLTAGRTLAWQLSTMRVVLPEHVPTPTPRAQIPIAPLSVDDAGYIHAHSMYSGMTSPAYNRERIRQGLSAGIRVSGKLVAWAMTHDDAALGSLHVLDAHRRKGYAQALMCHLIHRVRERGRIPFAQIEETNFKSMQMVLNMGFQKDRRVHWFELNAIDSKS